MLFSMMFATSYAHQHEVSGERLGYLIPRQAGVDFAGMRFVFYPTLILTWTALGLFFGVFLEGFMQGKHLRSTATKVDAEENA